MTTDAESIALLDETAEARREVERLRAETATMEQRIAELEGSEKIARISRITSRLASDLGRMAGAGLFDSSVDFGAHLAGCLSVMFDKIDQGEMSGIDGRQAFDVLLSLMVRRKVERDGPPKPSQN